MEMDLLSAEALLIIRHLRQLNLWPVGATRPLQGGARQRGQESGLGQEA